MNKQPLHIGLIYGSARQGRFCDTIAQWVLSHIGKGNEFSVDILDPKQLNLPYDLPPSDDEATIEFKSRLAACDAFIVVTPEYNHGYPAPLKVLIDAAKQEWQRKPVAFVSYGGISGGLRAVEQLRQVFAELHSVSIRDSVSFANPWDLFDSSGNLKQPEPLSNNLDFMLEHLKWWGQALQRARLETPAVT